MDAYDIVAEASEDGDLALPEVFVELKPHRSLWVGTLMMRSRAASAP